MSEIAVEAVTVTLPAAVGAKVTGIVQIPPAAKLEPHGFVAPKLALAAMGPTASAPVPVFVSVTVWATSVEPVAWASKVRPVGDSVTDTAR